MSLSKDMIVFKEIKKQNNFLVMKHKLLNKIICISFWMLTLTSDNDSPLTHVSELDELDGDGEGGKRVSGDTGSIFISSLIWQTEINI